MRKIFENEIKLIIPAKSVNEAFARTAVAAFAAQADPSIADVSELKTAVSEAVTNAIVHAYSDRADKNKCFIYISCSLSEKGLLRVAIKDKGKGIADVETAMQPLYTTDPEGERSGMGFTVMKSFSDSLKVKSKVGKGTNVVIEKGLIHY